MTPHPELVEGRTALFQQRDRAAPDIRLAETGTAIIGGGVIGVCAALALAQAGEAVVILERGQPNGEASGGNAGSLHVQLLSYAYADLEVPVLARALAALPIQRDSVRLWQDLSAALGADIEIKVAGGLAVADDAPSLARLDRKIALERRAGIAIERLSGAEACRLLPALSPAVQGASFSPDEGKLNPLKATPAVLRAALAAGARLLAGTAVIGIDREPRGFRLRTDQGHVDARRILNAAGAGAGGVAAMLGDVVPVRPTPLQMIVTERAAPMLDHLVAHVTRRLTLKQAASGNLVIGGGWAAPTAGPSAAGIVGNLAVAADVVPALRGLRVIRSWTATSGAVDGAPVLGPSPRVPGFFHAVTLNGMTLGPAVGRICADLVLGRSPGYDLAPFSPGRFA